MQTPLGQTGIISARGRNTFSSKTPLPNTEPCSSRSINRRKACPSSPYYTTRSSVFPEDGIWMSPSTYSEREHTHCMSKAYLGVASSPQSTTKVGPSRIQQKRPSLPMFSHITKLQETRSSLPPISLPPRRQTTRRHLRRTVYQHLAPTRIERSCKCRNGSRCSRVTLQKPSLAHAPARHLCLIRLGGRGGRHRRLRSHLGKGRS